MSTSKHAEPAQAQDWPIRELNDVRALRALAHPLRIKLVEELLLDGPATATQLAERLGDTAPNCSWHLRHLARFGFVEEAGGGAGRQRPWRYVPQGNRWGSAEVEALAVDAAIDLVAAREYQALRDWLTGSAGEDQCWRDAAFVDQSFAWVTPAELKELDEAIQAVQLRYVRRITDPSSRPAGARPVRLMAWGVPARLNT